jgi:glutamate synthase (NADPH/NADH) large chain
VQNQLKEHVKLTSSAKAMKLLNNWQREKERFYKVFPKEFKAILELKRSRLTQTK